MINTDKKVQGVHDILGDIAKGNLSSLEALLEKAELKEKEAMRSLVKERNVGASGWENQLHGAEEVTEKEHFAFRAHSHAKDMGHGLSKRKLSLLHHKLRAATIMGTSGRNVRAFFKRIDKNHDGVVSKEEFSAALKRLLPLSDSEMSMVWRLVKREEDGQINLKEFAEFLNTKNIFEDTKRFSFMHYLHHDDVEMEELGGEDSEKVKKKKKKKRESMGLPPGISLDDFEHEESPKDKTKWKDVHGRFHPDLHRIVGSSMDSYRPKGGDHFQHDGRKMHETNLTVVEVTQASSNEERVWGNVGALLSLTHSLTHSLTYSLTHSLTYSLTHIYIFTYKQGHHYEIQE